MEQKKLELIYGLIGKYLGYSIVDSYKNFYADKPDEIIYSSIEELLTDLIGPKAARIQLAPLKQGFKKKK